MASSLLQVVAAEPVWLVSRMLPRDPRFHPQRLWCKATSEVVVFYLKVTAGGAWLRGTLTRVNKITFPTFWSAFEQRVNKPLSNLAFSSRDVWKTSVNMGESDRMGFENTSEETFKAQQLSTPVYFQTLKRVRNAAEEVQYIKDWLHCSQTGRPTALVNFSCFVQTPKRRLQISGI